MNKNKIKIELLGLWEKLNNPDFKQVEFDLFKKGKTPTWDKK